MILILESNILIMRCNVNKEVSRDDDIQRMFSNGQLGLSVLDQFFLSLF